MEEINIPKLMTKEKILAELREKADKEISEEALEEIIDASCAEIMLFADKAGNEQVIVNYSKVVRFLYNLE